MVNSLTIQCSYAWDCHSILTYIALQNFPLVTAQKPVPAETLEHFLTTERAGLVHLLKNNETWSAHHIPFYPKLPAELYFTLDNRAKPITLQFAEAIRISPLMTFPLFIQYTAGVSHTIHRLPISRATVMLPAMANSAWIRTPNLPLEGINPDELVPPLDIITTAVDEPDYGPDIDLWVDNPSWFGKVYQWGEQSFGEKTEVFSTQAPFHMGFFYGKMMLYTLDPLLEHVYPEYRAHLFLQLSHYAFSTHHPYWGYRFLGFAIHYVQDLSQPYHATVLPNESMIKIIFYFFLNKIGIHSPEEHDIQTVTNRHFSLENYEYYLMKGMMEKHDNANPMMVALHDSAHDNSYPAYYDGYIREVVAKESHAKALEIDDSIRLAFPEKYVSDPNYIFYITEKDVNLVAVTQKNPTLELATFNQQLAKLLQNLGSHTRNVVRFILEKNVH